MPFAVGTVCFPLLLLISVYFLDIIPNPSSDDIKYRTKRIPMNKEEQNKFLKKFFFGLFMIILFYGVLTVFREMRDAFASNYWEEVGFFNTAIFTQTEIPIAIILTVLMGFVVFVKDNHTALNILYLIAVLGGLTMIGSIISYIYGYLSPIMWMIIVGTGLFMGYIPFSFIVERLISSLKISSTAVFVLYMCDSVGYFGTAGVFLYNNFSNTVISWNQMLTYTVLITGVSIIYNLQDIFPDLLVATGMTKKGSFLWKVGRVIENFTYRNADKIVVISQDFKLNIIAK